MKRMFDLLVSLVMFLLLFPIMIVVACLVRLMLGSPVIFNQKRPGKNEIPFYLYKFRTMNDRRDSRGNLLPDNLRLTPLGRLLRKYSLDELPQLYNVIKGDISLVGPRPLLMEYLPLYNEQQSKRHKIKPGITGWAQVNGRNAITWEEKFDLDVWYIENYSFLLDIKIIFLTFLRVIRADGIQNGDQVTMPLFKGSSTKEVKGDFDLNC